MTADYLTGPRLYRDVVFYGRLGEHRVGTATDRRTTDWLAERLALAGLRASFQPWAVRQFLLERAELRAAGEEVECFPLWFPRATGPGPVAGALAHLPPADDATFPAGRIALAAFGAGAEHDALAACEALVARAAAAGAAALLVRTEGPSGDIYAFNQERLEPQPLPVALVAPRDWPLLAGAADAGAGAALLIAGEERAIEARNVIGAHDGAGDDAPTIVVSTPSTGWFACAGERGPGIALFLALARWVGARRPPVRYLFTANAGHELGNLGMRHFLASGLTTPARVIGWLHLGASIGTVGWGEGASPARTIGATPDALDLLRAAFADLPHLEPVARPLGGEVPYVVDAGYRPIVGLAGRFPAFHTRADHAETATRPDLLAPIAAALTRLLPGFEERREA